MSFKNRVLLMVPAAMLAASWVAVRSMAAAPTRGLDDDPPMAVAAASAEVPDPVLGQLISELAAKARAPR